MCEDAAKLLGKESLRDADLVTISPTFYAQLLSAQIPKA
jgi:hypothetical protein